MITVKNAGTLLILSAAAWIIRSYYREQGARKKQLTELIWAFEHIETEIRWRHRPFPAIMQDLSVLPNVGNAFKTMAEMLTADFALQNAWDIAFSAFPDEISSVARRMDLSGDEKRLTDGFLCAAQSLRRAEEELEKEKKERGRLFTALTLCGAGLLLILLM